MAKRPISSLHLPPSTHLLVANLTPDLRTHSIPAFRDVLTTIPSILRRPRLLDPECHFSYVSPFPLPFPYRIPSLPDTDERSGWIEKWLSRREAIHARVPKGPQDRTKKLTVFYPENRDQPRELIGLAKTALDDCLPLLDVGDAFETLGVPSLTALNDENRELSRQDSDTALSARQELVDVLSGHSLLLSSENNFAPWALRYSGHQFGSWAGQLGDGRAISVREYTLMCSRLLFESLSDVYTKL